MGKLKKILIGFTGLLLFLFVIGMFASGTKDCKTDGDCFQEALVDCSSVKATIPSTMGYMEWKIMGKEGDMCKIHETVFVGQIAERDCLIKMDTILEGDSKTKRAVNIKEHLGNCTDRILS